MNPLLLKALPYVGIAALLFLGKCGYDAKQREIGAMGERLHVSDSTVVVLRRDSAQLVQRIARLRSDSATLATRGAQARAEFQRQLARWQALAGLVDTVPVALDDASREVLPRLEAIIQQANATIESCQADTASCEARAGNAELRRAEEAAKATNAEARAEQYRVQRDATRKLIPSGFQNATKTTGALIAGALFCFFFCPKR